MDESKPNDKRDKEVILRKAAYVATIASSITGLLTIGNYVPKVIFGAFLILTVVIILLLLLYVSPRLLQKWKEARRNKALVKKYFNDLALLSDRLGELLEDRRIDNIPYVFINLQNMPPQFYYPRSLIYDLANLLGVFKVAIKKVEKRSFRLLIRWFDFILRIYNSQLVLEPFQQIRNLYRDKLTEHDRENYEKSREKYVRFLQDYENFASTINKDCGEVQKVAPDSFDKPGKL